MFIAPGLHLAIGPYGSGKTSLIYDAIKHDPSSALVFDLELAGWAHLEQYNTQLQVLRPPSFSNSFKELYATVDNQPRVYTPNYYAKVFEWFIEQLDKHIKGKRVVVLDTGEALERGLDDLIDQQPAGFGYDKKNSAFGKMEQEIYRPTYLRLFRTMQDKGVEQIFMAYQLRQLWRKDAYGVSSPDSSTLDMAGRIKIARHQASTIVVLQPESSGRSSGLVVKQRTGEGQRQVPNKILDFSFSKLLLDYSRPENQEFVGQMNAADVAVLKKLAEHDAVQELMLKKVLPEQPEQLEAGLFVDPVVSLNGTHDTPVPDKLVVGGKRAEQRARAQQLESEGISKLEIAAELGISRDEVKELLK